MELFKINDTISKLESSDNPLSADVYFITGKEYTYIVDVGACENALRLINDTPDKKIIITHFHQDHAGNLKAVTGAAEIFVGSYTKKSTGIGTAITEKLLIEDGVKLEIIPIPSSHAKGSLGVLVNGEYLILGDSVYGSAKGYNVSLLGDEIALLQSTDFTNALMSHDNVFYNKNQVLERLKTIYSHRQKNENFIIYEDEY